MTFLDVPFGEKEQAKSLGARWDGVSKKWYVPVDLTDALDKFSKWLPNSKGATYNLSARYSEAVGSTKVLSEIKEGVQLSIILRNVQSTLRQKFPGATWVIAEIANLNNSRGHVYLELTESNEAGQTVANCRAMIWKSQAQGLLQHFETETGSPLSTGQKVLLLAEIGFHEQYGFSMVVQDVDPNYTLGVLEQNLNNIRKQLILEKRYAKNRQLKLSADFFRIAVIAPPAAAGLGDFRADADILQEAGLCEFTYFYSAFQGELIESEMDCAFSAIDALHQFNPFDALVVIRGGGAKLDLNMLNIYSLAKRFCESPIPILTGIGHERDHTILDEVSHLQFDTPSKIVVFIRHQIFTQAQQALAHWQQIDRSSRQNIRFFEQDLSLLSQKINDRSQHVILQWKQRLEPVQFAINKLGVNSVQSAKQAIDTLKQPINSGLVRLLELKRIGLEQLMLTTKVESRRVLTIRQQEVVQWISLVLISGPKIQLNRGFNIAKNPQDNKPITTAKAALEAKRIELQFADGSVYADVISSVKETKL